MILGQNVGKRNMGVEQRVSEHLRVQGTHDPREGVQKLLFYKILF
jgi:hypothetical protein